MSDWKPIGVVAEGQRIEIDGVNPWDHSWRSLEQASLDLPHPSYPAQRHKMKIYEVESAGRKVTFAAGELSPNVWGFYVAV
jgi:hypothetical protein